MSDVVTEVLGSSQQFAKNETCTFGSVIESLSRWTVRSNSKRAKFPGSLLAGSRNSTGPVVYSNNLITAPLEGELFTFRTTDKME